MSRHRIAVRQYEHYIEKDVREGVANTPGRRRFLWSLAEDFADEMAWDAAMERADDREVEGNEDE